MARKSLIARDEKRRRLYEKYKKKREELKAEGDFEALQKLPKNSSKVRIMNRCMFTGRARAYYRKFGVSRLVFREMALKGEIPGVKKSSW
jgi:small subunit ribosomal protein S14